MTKDSKIYIAGHRGLVGSAILRTLKAQGFTNFLLRTHQELDLLNSVDVADFFKTHQPDYVILAAAKVGGIVANNTYRAQFIYENLQIQNNVIHQSFLNKVKKLLVLGSTCIYPKNAPQPMSEDCLLTDELEYTNEPYAIAKIAGIKMCEAYNSQYGTNFMTVMPTNLYGPNDNFDLETSHVLPAMVRKIHLAKALMEDKWEVIKEDLRKRPVKEINHLSAKKDIIEALSNLGINKKEENTVLELWGTGKPLREFLWSDDMAEACVFLMENIEYSDIIKDIKGDIKNTHINIGTGKDISIKDLAYAIKDVIEFEGTLEFDSNKPDGTYRKLTDCSKIHGLGWQHSIEINEGLKMMYESYLKLQ